METCLGCGELYERKSLWNGVRKYCSGACKVRAFAKQKKAKEGKAELRDITKVCLGCKEPFTPKALNQVYHSRECYYLFGTQTHRNVIALGEVFDKLTVIENLGFNPKRGCTMYKCNCECGEVYTARGNRLRNGETINCGCIYKALKVAKKEERRLKEEFTRQKAKQKAEFKNAEAEIFQQKVYDGDYLKSYFKTPTYNSWASARQRTTNPRNKGWDYYGGRGIHVCDRWIDSFENFLKDMGLRPPGTSLDRINVNGHYEPGNCRWATPEVQSTNKNSVVSSDRSKGFFSKQNVELRDFLRTVAWG